MFGLAILNADDFRDFTLSDDRSTLVLRADDGYTMAPTTNEMAYKWR